MEPKTMTLPELREHVQYTPLVELKEADKKLLTEDAQVLIESGMMSTERELTALGALTLQDITVDKFQKDLVKAAKARIKKLRGE
jgi:hypothetical protein